MQDRGEFDEPITKSCEFCIFKEQMEKFDSLVNKLTNEQFIYRYNDTLYNACDTFLSICNTISANTGDDLESTINKGNIPWNFYNQVKRSPLQSH